MVYISSGIIKMNSVRFCWWHIGKNSGTQTRTAPRNIKSQYKLKSPLCIILDVFFLFLILLRPNFWTQHPTLVHLQCMLFLISTIPSEPSRVHVWLQPQDSSNRSPFVIMNQETLIALEPRDCGDNALRYWQSVKTSQRQSVKVVRLNLIQQLHNYF